jgi:hypothetical protein
MPRAADSALRGCLEALAQRGAAGLPHRAAQSFLDHLWGTYRILGAWGLPAAVRRAGLVHSCYSTQSFTQELFSFAERDQVRALIGSKAEALAFAFCTIDRAHFSAGLAARKGRMPNEGWRAIAFRTQEGMSLDRATAVALLAIEAANLAEQSCGEARAPNLWVSQCLSRLAIVRRHASGNGVRPAAQLRRIGARLCPEREARALSNYLAVVSGRAEPARLFEVAKANPFVAEPRQLLSAIALRMGAFADAWRWANDAVQRLFAWGTAWDKRRSWASWLAMALTLRARAAQAGRGRSRVAANRDLATALALCQPPELGVR